MKETNTPLGKVAQWKILEPGTRRNLTSFAIVAADGTAVASCKWYPYTALAKDEARARARLIAAAPSLLAACEAAEKVLIEGAHVMVHAQLRAAIAQAKAEHG